MKWAPYSKYKASGIEWLGEIPEHWEVAPIRAFAMPGYKTFTDGDWIESPYIRDEGIRLIQTGNIGVGRYREQGFRYIDEETFKQFRCTEIKPRDILICRLAEPVGRACLAPDLGVRMITSVDVCILKPRSDVDPAFVVYALSYQGYLSWMNSICRGGTRDRVSRSMLGSIRIQKPPSDEQRAIAAFLDMETARIDRLIEMKERQIELLQEKRTAVISHAVTKGLDPNVRMKDSGIEWLGEIPEHWEVYTLRRVAKRIQTGSTPPTVEAHYYENGSVPWYGPGSFGVDLMLNNPGKLIAEEAVRDGVARLFSQGSAMIVTIGATIGKVGYIERDASCNQQITVVTFDNSLAMGKFGAYQLKRLEPVLQGVAPSTTLPIMNQQQVGDMPIALPSLEEQKAIVVHIDDEARRIDTLIHKIHESIEKLREYRTALISAAVTGRIDVRGEVV